MKKTTIPLLLSCLVLSATTAQNPLVLTADRHAPRPGDRIVKQQVAFRDPGSHGQGIEWDFAHLQPVDEEYTLRYFMADSARLCGLEHRTRYYYTLRGDTLWAAGFENPTTRMDYVQAEPRLAFPFAYGDTLRGVFEGKGEYSHRTPLAAGGHTRTEADATGTLTLPCGTVQGALRVHTSRLYARLPGGQADSTGTSLRMDAYSWYAGEARYPVFESLNTTLLHDGRDTVLYATSFYYPPDEQRRQLSDDAEDYPEDVVLEAPPSGGVEGAIFTEADLVPNPVVDILHIKYKLTRDASIGFSVHNQQGFCMARVDARPQTAGRHETPIDMTACPTGAYTVYVLVDDAVLSLNVVKK